MTRYSDGIGYVEDFLRQFQLSFISIKIERNTIMNDWILAVLRWSDRWMDSATDVRGSAYYFIPTGDSYENDHGQELVFFNDDTDSAEPRPILRFNGGKATYEKLPPKAYINVNPDYEGSRLMTVEQHEKMLKKVQTATTKPSKRAQA